MAAAPIDYAALAEQARQSTPKIDYAALASQARGETAPAVPAGVPAGVTLGQPAAHPAVNMNDPSFDAQTQINPNDTLLQKGLKSVVGAVGSPFAHPLKSLSGLIPQDYATQYADAQKQPKQSLASGLVTGAGQAFGGLALGAAGGEALGAAMPAVKSIASVARDTAIGDTNAAALRGLQVGPRSPKALATLNSIEGARPYLGGAKDLQDLQSRIQPAKDEIFSEYNKAVQGIGDRKVVGPDGPTTVADLESQRLQLSALNRGLKANNPEAIQLAQQKGLTQADLLAKENAVKAALDPELASTGIDPRAIRKTFGNVAQVGSRISGKSTLIEPPQPSGFGKIANISIKQPFQAPGQVLSGLRDVVAGRPLLSAKPTDLGISEGFRTSGPKPQLGKFTMPTPPTTAGLLGRGSIRMPSPAEGGYISSTPPPYIDATTRAQRLGLLLPSKTGGPIELPYVPEMSAGEKLAAQMQLLRKNPQLTLPSKASPIPLSPIK